MWQFTKNKDWDSLREKFSWVRDMEDVPQDPIFHAEGNVAIHTQMVLEELQKLEAYQELDEQTQEVLWTAALLHDVEKRSTTIEHDGQIRSPFHAKKGEYTARQILYMDVPTPFEIREQIAKLVRYHGFPIWALEKKNAQKELFKVSLEVDTSLLAILAEADMRGRICEDQEDMLERIAFFKEFCLENECWGESRYFESDLAKFVYFQKKDSYVDYVPFDDAKCDVYVMCGFPGTGKDFYIRQNFPDLPMVSLDEIRAEYKISPSDGKAQGKVAQIARERMKVFLRRGQPFVLNATNISKDIRSKNLNLIWEYNCKPNIIYLEVPYKKLIQQNNEREDTVPLNVIHRCIRRLDMPSLVEGVSIEYKSY